MSKKNNNKSHFKKIKIIIFFLITIFIYIETLNLLERINLNIENDQFYEILINNSSSLSSDTLIDYEKIKEVLKPSQLLDNNLVYEDSTEINAKEETVLSEKTESTEPVTTSKNPIVYIYNTHQTENYSTEYLTEYTITPNIMITSYMLKENLEEYGIYSYVEEESVSNILNKNNWKYAKSYKVTRSFMETRSKEITTLKYYIDLHRDSVKKRYTTVEIDGQNYARIMLLVGLDHDNYQINLKEAEKINSMINKSYPGLSRGIYKKSGSGVNGIYNQDYSKYVFLFEIGGIDNNINEVNNTIEVLAKILSEYIKEEGA